GGGGGIGKQPADVGIVGCRATGGTRCDEGVDVAAVEHVGNGVGLGRGLEFHAGRQIGEDFFGAARGVDTATHPGNVFGRHAVVVVQQGAGPDDGGELVFRHANAAAFEVFRPLDAVAAYVDGGVAKRPRQERRNAHVGTLAV